MRVYVFILILIALLPKVSYTQVNKGEDKANLNAVELYDKGEFEKALEIVEEGIAQYNLTNKLLKTKYNILRASKKFEEALVTYEIIIERNGASPDVVADKIQLQMMLGRFDDALETSLKVDQTSKGESPYVSLAISRIYVIKHEEEKALEWLNKSFERGFVQYDYLLSPDFSSLHKDQRFSSLIKKMKEKFGIGLPAKYFSIPKFSGENYALSKDKGKVILLDFWATWCPPCRAEYPNLKKIYDQYKDQGFEIVSISADTEREALKKYLNDYSIPWINGFSAKGKKDDVISLYKIDSFPTYILIDRNGLIQLLANEGGDKLKKMVGELVKN